ncbi:MAG TPA: galactokinase [Candidatus Limnocylindrales bacterium]|nr:galactokinase [Candidatus Limnocylindrales bacterium]
MTDAFTPDDLRAELVARAPAAAADPGAIRIVRAPGRVNLIGEYTDVNEGLVLPAAIDREIRIAYIPSGDRRVELTRLDDDDTGAFDLDVPRSPSGTWPDYIAATAWALAGGGLPTSGLRGVIGSTLPENAGLSSSAAIELASAWALLGDAANGIDRLALARICQRAENGYVGVQSGLMDQFASSCGVEGAALLLDCRSTEWRTVAIPAGLRLVVCHTGSPRRLGSSEYNIRRAQCEAAVEGIRRVDPSVRSLRDVSAALLAEARSGLDPVVARRAEHVIAENDRVLATLAAFEGGDLVGIRTAFAASHASLRELFEVSSPELDLLVEIAGTVPGVVAARMTGAGFGGCTVNLVHAEAVGALAAAVLATYPGRTGLSPMILPVAPADGAGILN